MKKIMTLILALLCALSLSSCKTDNQIKRKSISGSAVATFEYIEDCGYKLITSEIHSLDSFDSLMLKPADTEFDGAWVYRIIFNPSKYSKYTEEIVVLFGEKCISINGTAYIGDGFSYSELLDWAEAKYKYFDYELITD